MEEPPRNTQVNIEWNLGRSDPKTLRFVGIECREKPPRNPQGNAESDVGRGSTKKPSNLLQESNVPNEATKNP